MDRLGAGGQRRARLGPRQEQKTELDPDQDQGITGRWHSKESPGPRPVDHGQEGRRAVQRSADGNAGSTRTKSSGSTGSNADRQKAEQRGKDGGSPKMHGSTCEQGCCGQSILAVTHRIKTPYRSSKTSPLRMH